MKLKLKRRFLLLPTVLLGTLLTAACTNNDQATSNTLNTKSSDSTESDTKRPNTEQENQVQSQTSDSQNQKADEKSGSQVSENTIAGSEKGKNSPGEPIHSESKTPPTVTKQPNSKVEEGSDSEQSETRPQGNHNMSESGVKTKPTVQPNGGMHEGDVNKGGEKGSSDVSQSNEGANSPAKPMTGEPQTDNLSPTPEQKAQS